MMNVFIKWLSHWYLQYELITCLYMFEPWEKKLLTFGSWLARYKEFFKDEDLNKDKSVVQSQLDETDKDYKIVITSNDVIKVLKTSQNCIIVMIISLVLYSSIMYLPHYTVSLLMEFKILQMDSLRTESQLVD